MRMLEINNILFLIEQGVIALPKFQRPYVWKRDDVKELMRSLYRGYPIGNLLIWDTQANPEDVKSGNLAVGRNQLLLDGQQRVTTLYGIIRGKKPLFSDADPRAFLNLYFNVDEEDFEFYAPRMKDDPFWVSVTDLMRAKSVLSYAKLFEESKQTEYLENLDKIKKIVFEKFYVEEVSSVNMSLDDVVNIFNKVNSGGRKLSQGDLALAKISAYWPEARDTMQAHFDEWHSRGYSINDYQYKFDWLLRCINAILTGHSDFAELSNRKFTSSDIQDGLNRASKHINRVLNLIDWRLGLDHRQVMGSPNSLPTILRLFNKENSNLSDRERDKLLYWYIHAMLWGRYTGTVESVIRQDLMTVDEHEDAVGALIERLQHDRGRLSVTPENFADWSRGSRFYPLLYMLTRVFGTCDLDEGIGLKQGLQGEDYQLQLHHIFPKARLYEYGYSRNEVNALANFTILFRKTNQRIGAKLPEVYFPHYESLHPGVLESHWIPMDENLWKIENYRDFLVKRRKRLAQASNDFLDQLYRGTLPVSPDAMTIKTRASAFRPPSVDSDEEEAALQQTMEWMEQQGLPKGVYGYELHDQENRRIATFDLAWPDGVKEGISPKIALLLDESTDKLNIANANGYRYFTKVDELQEYILSEILDEPA